MVDIEVEKKGPTQLEKLLEELVEGIRNAKSEEEIKLLEKKVDIIEDLINAYEGDRDLDKVAMLMDKVGPMIEDILGPLKELLMELYSPEKMQAMGKSVAEFYKNLVEAGMDKETATELTKEYMNSINAAKSLLEMFQGFVTKGISRHGGPTVNIVHSGKKGLGIVEEEEREKE
ncbi:hypothetical protein E3E36_02065 [Thermococcus sp. M36]|uniref:hypothetical protein n=1 Tax=Thermococcus sp. M36 TaxID=1638261 RepID=UPI00143C6F8A|nr:hypothetical protein [Thermococcus sp. M36]NJE04953.1 hypothetical protein [Thermococcus sp. M36]